MNGAQAKFAVEDLRNTRYDDAALKVLIEKQLVELASFDDLELSYLLPLAPEIFDVVRKETDKFSSDRKRPYPPVDKNNLSVQVTLPTKGRVGVVEYNTRITV